MISDLLEVFIPYVLFLVLAIGSFMVLGHFYGSYQCGQYEDITGYETKYSAFDMCYVQHDGEWKRWDEYKAIQRNVKLEGAK